MWSRIVDAEPDLDAEYEFTSFVRDSQDGIRRALVAGFGPEIGCEATEEALIHAWKRWGRVRRMSNRPGYVYRVGHRLALKMRRSRHGEVALPDVTSTENPIRVEPALPSALRSLSARQRTVVVCVYAYGMSQRDTAEMLGISRSSVQRHLDRGLTRLRRAMGVNLDA